MPHTQGEPTVWNPAGVRVPDCKFCGLHKSAKTVCLLGDGPAPCKGMIIGGAPGAPKKIRKEFLSAASRVSSCAEMLKEIGLDPRKLFITNVVACRPPRNLTPKRSEAKTCSELYLSQQIELVHPKSHFTARCDGDQLGTRKKVGC